MTFPARLLEHIVPPRTSVNTRIPATLVDRLLGLSADQIRHLWDPATCPEAELPYLAWALSVDIWNSDWPISKKRSIVASAFSDHKHKGTQYLIDRYLGYVGATLVRTIAPPAKAFSVGGFADDASRLRWLGTLPQVRIYPYLTRRTPPVGVAFYSGPRTTRSFYKDVDLGSASFAQASYGPTLMGQKATYVKDGVEIPVSIETLIDPDGGITPIRVSVSTKSQTNFYGYTSFNNGFMQASDAEDNVIAVRLQSNQGSRFSVSPGSIVTDVQPARVNQTRIAPQTTSFYGQPGRQRFMLTSYGPNLVYDQISILDPNDVLFDQRRKTRFFYGFCRYGIAPFTAELAVDVPMTRSRCRLGTFYVGFMQKADMTPLYDALGAIGQAKSLRDKIFVDTEIYRPVQLSDELALGSFTLGETIKIK